MMREKNKGGGASGFQIAVSGAQLTSGITPTKAAAEGGVSTVRHAAQWIEGVF